MTEKRPSQIPAVHFQEAPVGGHTLGHQEDDLDVLFTSDESEPDHTRTRTERAPLLFQAALGWRAEDPEVPEDASTELLVISDPQTRVSSQDLFLPPEPTDELIRDFDAPPPSQQPFQSPDVN